MPKRTDLNDCPLCDGKAVVILPYTDSRSNETFWYIRCSDCVLSSTEDTDLEIAKQNWNSVVKQIRDNG